MDWELDTNSNAAPAETILPVNSKRTFSLATLFLLVTAFSVWMGLAVTVPNVAVPGLMFLIPAIVRGFAETVVVRKENYQLTFAEKTERFSYSFLVVALIYTLTFGIIFCVLTASVVVIGPLSYLLDLRGLGRLALYGIAIASIPASLIIAIWLYWRWWPRKGKRPW